MKHWGRWLFGLLIVMMIIGFLPGAGVNSAHAETIISFNVLGGRYEGSDLKAILSDDGKTLTYTGTTDSAVPQDSHLLQACERQNININKEAIETVIISDNNGFEAIDWYAFYGFTGLKSITIPDTVTKIYSNAFRNCTSLREISFYKIDHIADDAFKDCQNIKVTIHDGKSIESVLEIWGQLRNNPAITLIAYIWADDNSTVTGKWYRSGYSEAEEIVQTTYTTTATCQSPGYGTYIAYFTKSFFSTQTRSEFELNSPHQYDVRYIWADDYSSCSAFISCKNCDYTDEELNHASTCADTATCTQDGIKTYTVEFTDPVFGTATEEIPSPAHHRYNISYTWGDDDSTCTASATCSVCQDFQGETVQSTCSGSIDCGSSGYLTYTAVFENPIFEKQTESVFTINTGHTMVHHDEALPVGETAGNIEYWTCSSCGRYFTDPDGDNDVSVDDVKTYNITWVLNNGSDNDVTVWRYGTVPAHSAPVKPSTATEVYPFTGWDPAPTAVTGAKTYTATYATNPVPTHTLSITYQYADGTQAAEAHMEQIAEGTAYYVDSPVITGYTPDPATVSGTMNTSDVNVTVTYTENPAGTHTLTIRYVYADNTQAANTYTHAYAEGMDYAVDSPDVPGFRPDPATVSGMMGTSDVNVTVTYTSATYIVTVNNGTGSGDYVAGASVSITAEAPVSGKRFKEWTGADNLTFTSGSATSAEAVFTMPAQAVTLTATYEDIPATTYTVTVNNGTGSGEYAEGASVAITAEAPVSGKRFKEWTGADNLTFTSGSTTSAEAVFTMPAQAVTITATYEDIPVTVYTVTINNGTGSGEYVAGASVSITADAPASGKRFKEWTGADNLTFTSGSATSTEAVFTMPAQAVTLTATYEDIPATTYMVTVNSGTGSGEYVAGASVTITADAPASGKRFKEWTGADNLTFTSGSATSAEAVFTMPAQAVMLNATYEDIPATTYTFTVNDGTGSGEYTEGASVTITADAPAPGKRFKEWIGADNLTFTSGSTTSAEAVFTMPAQAVTLTATYDDTEVWKITFAANGGSGEMPGTSVDRGQKYTLPPCSFIAPENKEFDTWDLGTPGSEVNITADTVIIAQWKDKSGNATYTLIEAEGVEQTINENVDLTVDIKRSIDDDLTFDNYTSADMDDQVIPEKHISKSRGSLILTVEKEYMATLAVGNHTLKVKFSDGSVTIPVKIKAAVPTDSPSPSPTPAPTLSPSPAPTSTPTPHPVPQTGDNDNPALWIGLILLGIAGLAVLVTMKASRKRK